LSTGQRVSSENVSLSVSSGVADLGNLAEKCARRALGHVGSDRLPDLASVMWLPSGSPPPHPHRSATPVGFTKPAGVFFCRSHAWCRSDRLFGRAVGASQETAAGCLGEHWPRCRRPLRLISGP